MAETKTSKSQNIYQKLLTAREKFLEQGISKSGKHMELKYKYFELDDIVPIAIDIFSRVGLIPLVSFTEEQAIMTIVNTDKPEETIEFFTPMRYPSENRMVNPVQALGSAQTYLRRYLYMIALDICEPDTIEPTTVKETPAVKVPVTTEERTTIKQELTSPKDNASALQIKQLKTALKKLKEVKPDKEEMIAKIAVDTKGFTDISKEDCEAILSKVSEWINEVGE